MANYHTVWAPLRVAFIRTLARRRIDKGAQMGVRRTGADGSLSRKEETWLFGTCVSLFGSNAMYVAFVVWIQQLTHSPSLAAMAVVAFLAPSVLSPISGLVADRVQRARLLIGTDLAQAVWVCFALLVRDANQVWLIFVVLVGLSLGSGLEAPAASALLATVVGRDRLARVNALFRTFKDLARTAGPAIGALISQVAGVRTLILVDAATFALSAVCVWQLKPQKEPPVAPERPILYEMAGGFRHIFQTPALRRVVGAVSLSLLVFGMRDPVLIYLIPHSLQQRPGLFGVFATTANVGNVIGGLMCVRIIDRLSPERLVRIGLAVMSAAVALFVVPYTFVVGVGCFAIGVGATLGIIGYVTVVLHRTPSHLQGRVMSATDTAISGPQALSAAAGVGLLAVVPFQVLVLSMAAAVLLCAGSLTAARLRDPQAAQAPGGASGSGEEQVLTAKS